MASKAQGLISRSARSLTSATFAGLLGARRAHQERRLQRALSLVDLGVPFVYSSVHANARMLSERPDVVQRVVAAFAETIDFVEKIPTTPKLRLPR